MKDCLADSSVRTTSILVRHARILGLPVSIVRVAVRMRTGTLS